MATKLKMLQPSRLEQLVAAGKPIYILNTSSLPDGNKGMIVVNFFDTGGRREFFKVPPTFIPMAISDVIPSRKLLESRDFKQCLVKGMLTLVDSDTAEDYLSTREAQDEYEALTLSEHSLKFQGLDVEQEVVKRTRVAHQSSEGNGPVQDVSAVDTVSNKVRGLVESMVSNDKSPDQVMVELRRHQSALSAVDISYVMSNSTDAKLTTWARKALSEASNPEAHEAAPVVAKKVTIKKPAKEKSSFDFSDSDDVKMTPAEAKADADARAKAMQSQAVNGHSKVEDEINAMMSGKRY